MVAVLGEGSKLVCSHECQAMKSIGFCGSKCLAFSCNAPSSVVAGAMTRAGWKKPSGEEVRLAKSLYAEGHLKPSEIAARLEGNKSVITLTKQAPHAHHGRRRS